MNKKEAIEKVKKLLALSKSTNLNEAALAMSSAQALMDKFSLQSSDIEAGELGTEEIQIDGKIFREWETIIFQAVCDRNGVVLYTNRHKALSYCLVGRENNKEISKLLFEYLRGTGLSLGSKIPGWEKYKFLKGYAVGIAGKLYKDEGGNWTPEEKNALILSRKKDEEEAREYLRLQGVDLQAGDPFSFPRDKDSYQKGFDASNEVPLNRQMKDMKRIEA